MQLVHFYFVTDDCQEERTRGRGDAVVIDVEGKASGVLDEFGPDTAILSEVDEATPSKAADTIALLTRIQVETITRLSNPGWTKPKPAATSFLESSPAGTVKPPITRSVELECHLE